jgi:malic enzyme
VREGARAALYPALEDVRTVSSSVALAVATEAQRQGLCNVTTQEEVGDRIAAKMWNPRYARYVRSV